MFENTLKIKFMPLTNRFVLVILDLGMCRDCSNSSQSESKLVPKNRPNHTFRQMAKLPQMRISIEQQRPQFYQS